MQTKTRILVVEDELFIAEDIRGILLEANYDVIGTASSADEAMMLARIHEPNLVLLDVVINGARDGISTAMAIKRDFDAAIVFLTSRSDDATLTRAESLAPNGYLLKPFTTQELLVAVRTGLANYKMASQSTQIFDENLARETEQIKGGLAPSNLAKVEDYVEKNMNGSIKIELLASMCGLSEPHFATQFKKTTGVSPGRYILAKRIDEAKCMLTETKLPVAEISAALGYSNVAHFSTIFKKTTGVTPSQYRSA